MKRNGAIRLFKYLLIVIAILSAGFMITHFLVQRTVVRGSSMEPALSDRDNLLIYRAAYLNSPPKRFDIVVFTDKRVSGSYYIKRVIGLPGETVEISDQGYIFINGKRLSDKYGRGRITDPGQAAYGVRLKSGQYFVLGDNRNHSEDSRFADIGMVGAGQIIGKGVFRFFPFDRFGKVR